MISSVDGRGHRGNDGGSGVGPRSTAAHIRRFRIKHALRSIEDALTLLEGRPAEGIDTSALERVRDDLAVVLRQAQPVHST
jgi:hypothetical protein